MRFVHNLAILTRTYRIALLWAIFSTSVVLYTRLVLVPRNQRLAEGKNIELRAPLRVENPNYHEVTVPKLSEKDLAKKYKPKPNKSDIKWPKRWTSNGYQDLNGQKSDPVTCDMRSIVSGLRSIASEKATERKFKGLPKRYLSMHYPRNVAPTCGGELLSPWRVMKEAKKDLWMMYVIKSAPSYAENRQAVRETWGSTNAYEGKRIAIVFLIGKTNDKNVNEELRRESVTHGDILQCDIIDGYDALPRKVLSSFRWILMKDLRATFYSITDDDCLIDMPHMQDHFKTIAEKKGYEKNLYCGYVYDEDSKPFREEMKWSLTKDLYSGEIFPTFCHGALWTLSKPLINAIYCVSEITDYVGFFLEDVLITGILREKLGFGNANIKKTIDKRVDPVEDLFLFHAGHKATAETAANNMRREWRKRQRQ